MQVYREYLRDIDMSIHFKFGTHTIFLFVEPSTPISEIAAELLEVLTERYPTGLTSIEDQAVVKTDLPSDPSQIVFGKPKSPTDPSLGWTALRASGEDTLVKHHVKDNESLAFTFKPKDAGEDYEVKFQVFYPNPVEYGDEQ